MATEAAHETVARVTMWECPRCAAQVSDREKHMDWHDQLGR